MPSDSKVLCYNRGCGQTYDPQDNQPDACRHHSGLPVFHDAYKGWSCCKKKCTDFTEFLNIKGCTVSCHSNIKPPEPEKPKVDEKLLEEAMEVRQPVTRPSRPPPDSPMVELKIEASQGLRDAVAGLRKSELSCGESGDGSVPIGTSCKNNGCSVVYSGEESRHTTCVFHTGFPVFHEGLKFWTCCNKKTTDFNSFLGQAGCACGSHVWFKAKAENEVKCRLDWHQTGSDVVVTVFGKKCDPDKSSVRLSSVKLRLELYFPEQGGYFIKELVLRGVVVVEASSVSLNPSKLELKMKKRDIGSWSSLDLPDSSSTPTNTPASTPDPRPPVDSLTDQVDAVDLSDLTPL